MSIIICENKFLIKLNNRLIKETLGDSEFEKRLNRIQSNNFADPKVNNKPIEPKDVGLEDEVVDASPQSKDDDNLGKNWQNLRHYK